MARAGDAGIRPSSLASLSSRTAGVTCLSHNRLAVPAPPQADSHDHGILCTAHAERGVDAVPVAYAVDDDGYVGGPIDRVKPKASLRLQPERYPQYQDQPFARVLVLHIVGVVGWAADDRPDLR